MSGARQPAPDELQPLNFEFTAERLEEAKKHIAKYPAGKQQSAVMPLLTLAQQQHDGWVPRAAIETIADMLGMPSIRVYEVATFYTMYNLAPVGYFHIQCCTTTPCWLRGSDDMVKACKDELGIGFGEVTDDGKFGLSEVECLGACVNAPMLEVTTPEDDVYYEDLDYDKTVAVIKAMKAGELPKIGSQNGRVSSEPVAGLTSLEDQQADLDKIKKAG